MKFCFNSGPTENAVRIECRHQQPDGAKDRSDESGATRVCDGERAAAAAKYSNSMRKYKLEKERSAERQHLCVMRYSLIRVRSGV